MFTFLKYALDTHICIKPFVFCTTVREDTLTDMVSTMREDVGLVHQMPFASDRSGLPSTLEKVQSRLHNPQGSDFRKDCP